MGKEENLQDLFEESIFNQIPYLEWDNTEYYEEAQSTIKIAIKKILELENRNHIKAPDKNWNLSQQILYEIISLWSHHFEDDKKYLNKQRFISYILNLYYDKFKSETIDKDDFKNRCIRILGEFEKIWLVWVDNRKIFFILNKKD